MRIAELLGAAVVDRDGRTLGAVHDVRLVQDGPPLASFDAALTLNSLLFGPIAVGARLGYGRHGVKGPWVLKTIFERIHGRHHAVEWEQIAAIEPRRIHLRTDVDDLLGVDRLPSAGRTVDAGLDLLDRQLIDPDGRMAGNVDDLELTIQTEGGRPVVTAILAGPGALAERLGGRPGRLIAAVHHRLQDREVEGPSRIDFGVVRSIGSDVRLTVSREDLPTMRVEAWARDMIIARIPGNARPSA
jgi:sporulation protein YlmC with PRC-barrel domain